MQIDFNQIWEEYPFVRVLTVAVIYLSVLILVMMPMDYYHEYKYRLAREAKEAEYEKIKNENKIKELSTKYNDILEKLRTLEYRQARDNESLKQTVSCMLEQTSLIASILRTHIQTHKN